MNFDATCATPHEGTNDTSRIPAPLMRSPAWASDRGLHISLRQWRLFHAVVDNGGFVGAANKLHVSQSSISHALAKLQEELGVPLLVLIGRKAHLTEQGKALLERSRELVRQAVQLEEFGHVLRQGWEPEVHLAVEPSYPSDLLMRALRDASVQAHGVPLCVSEMGFAEVRTALHEESVDLAIASTPVFGFSSEKLIDIEHVAVAHADDPLFATNRNIGPGDLINRFQIVFKPFEPDATAAARAAAASQRCWRVQSLECAVDALQCGLGYAWLPRYRVQHSLDDGSLRILPLTCGSSYTTQMHLIRGRAAVGGSRALHIADLLRRVTHQGAAPPGCAPVGGVGHNILQ